MRPTLPFSFERQTLPTVWRPDTDVFWCQWNYNITPPIRVILVSNEKQAPDEHTKNIIYE